MKDNNSREYSTVSNVDAAADTDTNSRDPNKSLINMIGLYGPNDKGKSLLARALTRQSRSESGSEMDPWDYEVTDKSESPFPCIDVSDYVGVEDFKSRLCNIPADFTNNNPPVNAVNAKAKQVIINASKPIILVFDANNQASFSKLSQYCEETKEINPTAAILLVGIDHNQEGSQLINAEQIEQFKRENKISDYFFIHVNKPEDLNDLSAAINHHITPQFDAIGLAKKEIEGLRGLFSKIHYEYQDTINKICNLLNEALSNSATDNTFGQYQALLQIELEKLRFAHRSIWSSVRNTVATVAVCITALATGFLATPWLYKLLEENYKNKGDFLLFSTSGEKQAAQAAIYKTKLHLNNPDPSPKK